MSSSRVSVEDYAGVAVVKLLDGSLLDAASIEPVSARLNHLVDDEHKVRLIVDLSAVKLLSSQILGVLTSLNRKCRADKGALVLCGVRRELMQMFVITGLDAVLTFCKNDSEALATFGIHVE